MVDQQDLNNIDEKGIAFTIRSVFVIDPSKKIRLTVSFESCNLCFLNKRYRTLPLTFSQMVSPIHKPPRSSG